MIEWSYNLIEEHIDECDSCKNTLKAMREHVGKSVDIVEKKEIDFLRKTRKKANTMMIGTVLAAVLLITGFDSENRTLLLFTVTGIVMFGLWFYRWGKIATNR